MLHSSLDTRVVSTDCCGLRYFLTKPALLGLHYLLPTSPGHTLSSLILSNLESLFDEFGLSLVLLRLWCLLDQIEAVGEHTEWATWTNDRSLSVGLKIPHFSCVSFPSAPAGFMSLVNVLVALVAELVVGWHPGLKTSKHLEAVVVRETNWTGKEHNTLLHVVDLDVDLLHLQVLVCFGVSLASQRQRNSIGVCWEKFPDESGDNGRKL